MKLSHRFLTFILALSMLSAGLSFIPGHARAVDTQVVDITMYIGQIYSFSDSNGAYNTYTSTNSNVSVELSPTVRYELGDAVTVLDTDQKYYIQNTRSSDMLTGTLRTSGGFVTSGSVDNIPDNSLWQVSTNGSANNPMYALFQESGKHLTMTSGGGNLSGQDYNLYLEYQAGGYWYIRDGINGLNDYGGNQGRAAGYGDLDGGSRWIFYTATNQSVTDVTLTATSTGIANITIGNTVYRVTVLDHPDTTTLDSTPIVNSADTNQKITSLTVTAGFSLVDLDIAENFVVNDSVAWSTKDSSIANVSSTGVVTGVAAGTTELKASIDGQTITIPVKVLPYSGSTTDSRTFNIYIDKLLLFSSHVNF